MRDTVELAVPLGTPLGMLQWKRGSSRGEAGTSDFLSVSDSARDRGAWGAAIYGVAQSWTRLKRLSRDGAETPQGCCSNPSAQPHYIRSTHTRGESRNQHRTTHISVFPASVHSAVRIAIPAWSMESERQRPHIPSHTTGAGARCSLFQILRGPSLDSGPCWLGS